MRTYRRKSATAGRMWPDDLTAMILVAELDGLAAARLEDAKVLLASGRYDGAVYMCGYAVEIALKARICRMPARHSTLLFAPWTQKSRDASGRFYQSHVIALPNVGHYFFTKGPDETARAINPFVNGL